MKNQKCIQSLTNPKFEKFLYRINKIKLKLLVSEKLRFVFQKNI